MCSDRPGTVAAIYICASECCLADSGKRSVRVGGDNAAMRDNKNKLDGVSGSVAFCVLAKFLVVGARCCTLSLKLLRSLL